MTLNNKLLRPSVILLVCFVLLFVQFAFSLKIKEPYPAILFPGFGNVHKDLSEIKISKYKVLVKFSDHQDTTLDATSVFNSFPNWYVSRVCEHLLHKPLSEDIAAERKAFEQWLKQKASEATNRQDIISVDLSKNINTFSLQERKIVKEQQLLSRGFNLKD